MLADYSPIRPGEHITVDLTPMMMQARTVEMFFFHDAPVSPARFKLTLTIDWWVARYSSVDDVHGPIRVDAGRQNITIYDIETCWR